MCYLLTTNWDIWWPALSYSEAETSTGQGPSKAMQWVGLLVTAPFWEPKKLELKKLNLTQNYLFYALLVLVLLYCLSNLF